MNKKIVWGVAGVIVLVVVFYTGVSVGKGQTSPASGAPNTNNGQAFNYNGNTSGTRGMRGGGFGGNGFTMGQIISKDATSITVELSTPQAGATSASGSKIILLNPNTKITKQTNGTLSDLTIGTNVSVTGATDSGSGSVTAQSIQIRPNMPQGAKVQ